MTLPILMSVPHAGLEIPKEVKSLNRLTPVQIREDGDEGAREIYAIESDVLGFVTTEVARAFVDMNRAETDIRKDGVIKTHTCWNVPIYKRRLDDLTLELLLENYHRPYHRKLSYLAAEARVGIDGHTMARVGPPVGPDPGQPRPKVCLSNGEGTCPDNWVHGLASALEETLGIRVSINEPFKGGHIIRAHQIELPWIQIEFSRDRWIETSEKRRGLVEGLELWVKRGLG